jgi:hypothetical protein
MGAKPRAPIRRRHTRAEYSSKGSCRAMHKRRLAVSRDPFRLDRAQCLE